MSVQFKVGQKVQIVRGGWGFNPTHVGKIVTIHSAIKDIDQSLYTRYTTEETLAVVGFTQHVARFTTVCGQSFEAVEELDIPAQIREVNVLIAASSASIAGFKERIEVEEQAKQKLSRQRQVLVATLLRELDV